MHISPHLNFPPNLLFSDLLAVVEPPVGREVDGPAGAQPRLHARHARALLGRQRRRPGTLHEVLRIESLVYTQYDGMEDMGVISKLRGVS